MISNRTLTKSRFKLALECPNKLFYTKKRTEWTDNSIDDPFMEALAEGGFQVGELAKCYKPNGLDVITLDEEEALRITNKELERDHAIIYEGAFRWNNCFVRVDLIVKKGNNIGLYEVKAKSYNGEDNAGMLKKDGTPKPKWKPYLYDVAFQKYVIENAFPEFNVTAYLTLVDKDKLCSVDGIHQKFLIDEVDGRKKVTIVGDVNLESLGEQLLTDVYVDDIAEFIFEQEECINGENYIFSDMVDYFVERYNTDTEIPSNVRKECVTCQFRDDLVKEKSGFHRCWKREVNFSNKDFERVPSFELWAGLIGSRSLKSEFIEKELYFMDQVKDEDFAPKNLPESDEGMTTFERRQFQVSFAKGRSLPVIKYNDLKSEMGRWKFPLHFIDFETTALAIPMHKGMKPYEGVAFQFSHHTVDEIGNVKHKGEWINTETGKNPNFDFIRALYSQLKDDEGTIFRYHNHENTYVNMIYNLLSRSNEVDKEELMSFIESIAKPTGSNKGQWEAGSRNMVDLYQVVLKYFIHPSMKGSNSIKKVLPAVMESSSFIQEKYSKPIYGKEIESLNFREKVWVEYDENGKIKDPYKLLDPIFDEKKDQYADQLITDNDELKDGGAAMVAYARMQFTEMKDYEREQYKEALLKYCELDTLAMVMIWEYLNDIKDNEE